MTLRVNMRTIMVRRYLVANLSLYSGAYASEKQFQSEYSFALLPLFLALHSQTGGHFLPRYFLSIAQSYIFTG